MADKYSIKKSVVSQQKEQISALENMIDYLHNSHQHMIKLYEQKNQENPKLMLNTEIINTKPVMLKCFTPRQKQHSRKSSISTPKAMPISTPKHFTDMVDRFLEKPLEPETEQFHDFFRAKLNNLETNLELQKIYNQELKKTSENHKLQSETYQKMLNDFEKDIFKAQREERER